MSAIDFYCTVDKVKGADGKDRAVITFDGKYLPHTEQVRISSCVPSYSIIYIPDNFVSIVLVRIHAYIE
jgi:hypothetical protein